MAAGGLTKTWRNSACLILASGAFKYNTRPLLKTSLQAVNPKSTPVCLQDFQTPDITRAQLEFLMLKRSEASSFMPSNHVFPGGVLDTADFSLEWMSLFKGCAGAHPFASVLELGTPRHTRVPLYGSVPPESTIPGEVAFRICAIREVFEEAGILLARGQGDVSCKSGLVVGSFAPAVKVLPTQLRDDWRLKVHSNANEFINMCRELNCVPDIWSLIEWSTWLTPRNFHKRFDTMFYLCCTETKPEVFIDKMEVSDAQWLSSQGIIENTSINVAPPQAAEIYRFHRFGSPSSVHSYALHQSLHGSIPINRPVRVKTKDSIIMSVLGEDDLYPLEEAPDHQPPEHTHHHPQAVPIRERVHLMTTNHMLYEYKIPTHTAKDLHQCSPQTMRFEFGVPIVPVVSVFEKKMAEHELRYQLSLQECLNSKL